MSAPKPRPSAGKTRESKLAKTAHLLKYQDPPPSRPKPYWVAEPACTSATRCAGTRPCRCGYPTCRDGDSMGDEVRKAWPGYECTFNGDGSVLVENGPGGAEWAFDGPLAALRATPAEGD